MENRKRNIQMKFYVTEEEKRLIDEKMKQLPIKQYGAYFRKMAIDGYILVVDRSDTKAYIRELQAVSRNINQIAKRANATGTVYRQDIYPAFSSSFTASRIASIFSRLIWDKPARV